MSLSNCTSSCLHLRTMWLPGLPPVVLATDLYLRLAEDVTSPNGAPLRIYTQTNHSESTALPLILFAHSGGWFAGNLNTKDRSCPVIASRYSVMIVSADYRCNFDVPL